MNEEESLDSRLKIFLNVQLKKDKLMIELPVVQEQHDDRVYAPIPTDTDLKCPKVAPNSPVDRSMQLFACCPVNLQIILQHNSRQQTTTNIM